MIRRRNRSLQGSRSRRSRRSMRGMRSIRGSRSMRTIKLNMMMRRREKLYLIGERRGE